MRTTRFFVVTLAMTLLLGSLSSKSFAGNPHCSAVGGMILTNLGGFGTIDGLPTTMGVATGDLRGALGVQVTSASPDFTTINVQHHWVTDTGETLNIDPAALQGVYVDQGLLAVKDYKVHLSGGTGRYAHVTGDMNVIGEIDFNTGQAVLRYSGNVCSTGNE